MDKIKMYSIKPEEIRDIEIACECGRRSLAPIFLDPDELHCLACNKLLLPNLAKEGTFQNTPTHAALREVFEVLKARNVRLLVEIKKPA